MTLIDTLKQDYTEYLKQCLSVLDTKIDIIKLDYSNYESDVTHLLFIEKKDLKTHDAIAILTMRMLMYQEDWNDLKRYKKEDIEHWISILAMQYESSIYEPNVLIDDFKKDYFVERLTKSIGLKNIKINAKTVDFLGFKRINPLFHEKTIAVSKTKFTDLKAAFYVETTHHFVLFSWFKTA